MSLQTIHAFCLLSCVLLGACGLASTTSGSSGSSGDDTSSGASDTTSTEVFTVSGTVSVASSSLSTKASAASTVTHVMAVSPEAGNAQEVVSEVASDGTFAIDIIEDTHWMICFLDNLKEKSDKLLGWMQAKEDDKQLDTLAPTAKGAFNAGSLQIDELIKSAVMSSTISEVATELGQSSDDLKLLADQDGSAAACNPDKDGDNIIDAGATASASQFGLDFHVRFNMQQSGATISVTDIVDNYPSASTTTASYSSTGVYVYYHQDFSTTTSDLTFTAVTDDITTELGGALTQSSPSTDITINNFGNYYGGGPNLTSTSETIQGDVVYTFGGKELTFTNVKMPALASLTAPTGRIFPFVKFDRTDTACTASCTISGLSFKWMKKTSDGWTVATLSELALLVKAGSGTLGFRVNNDVNTQISFTLSETALEGTVALSEATLTGMTSSAAAAMLTTEICHIGLSFDDKLGMRYFQNINNATGTCASN